MRFLEICVRQPLQTRICQSAHGHGEMIGVRLPAAMIKKIGKIAEGRSESRSDAVRWLLRSPNIAQSPSLPPNGCRLFAVIVPRRALSEGIFTLRKRKA